LKPDASEAHNNLGVILIQLGDFKQGCEHLIKAAQLNPRDKDIVLNFGDIMTSNNRPLATFKAYSDFLRERPGDEDIMR